MRVDLEGMQTSTTVNQLSRYGYGSQLSCFKTDKYQQLIALADISSITKTSMEGPCGGEWLLWAVECCGN